VFPITAKTPKTPRETPRDISSLRERNLLAFATVDEEVGKNSSSRSEKNPWRFLGVFVLASVE